MLYNIWATYDLVVFEIFPICRTYGERMREHMGIARAPHMFPIGFDCSSVRQAVKLGHVRLSVFTDLVGPPLTVVTAACVWI